MHRRSCFWQNTAVLHFKNIRLRDQLLIFFFLLLGSILTFSGIYVDWQLRRVIEKEIAQKLTTIASLAAAEASATQVLNLVPGDDSSRTAQNLAGELRIFTQTADISRLLISDHNFRVFYDSQKQLTIGSEYFRLRFDAAEIERVLQDGQPRASKLFHDSAGAAFKAAYAPIRDTGRLSAFVCVEGSAAGLLAVEETRSALLTLGALALLIALLFALFVARQITKPIEQLKHAAETIARGAYQQKVEIDGSSEVAFLSQTIDDMRQAIAQRHQQQQMMLAGIAHEIRNPLGGIELFASLLQKKLDGDPKASVDKILTEVQHLKQIVNDFLEFAKPTAPERKQVALQKAVQHARDLVAATHPHVAWQCEIDPALHIRVDPDHLRRILINLFQNACEALADRTDGHIAVEAQKKQARVLLTIRDNGPGISEAHRDRIFQPFFTTRHQGTGLGLAIVKLLVEENEGEISVGTSNTGCEIKLLFQSAKPDAAS